MGAPKAGDRDHACQMAQSGFESVEITNNANKTTVDAEQVGGVLLVAPARGRETEGSRRLI